MTTEIEVHIDLNGTTHRVGTMRITVRGGRNTAMFEYASDWRAVKGSFDLEPALAIGRGPFYPDRGREMFGSLSDSAPDTWGRNLMRRMERRNAEKEGRAVRTLTEADYLLGVADLARLGALRFRRAGETEFQRPITGGNIIPPLIELPKLLSVTERVVRDEETDDDLLLLFAPGSSLGGARPKASIIDRDKHLMIAKFSKDGDDWSIGAWEEVGLRLAKSAGVDTSEHRIQMVAGKHVFLSRRFDRTTNGMRIPFLSAMSMMNRVDGEKGSYPEIVDVLRSYGVAAKQDAEELFRRMIVNILVSNVDDHLRNHRIFVEGRRMVSFAGLRHQSRAARCPAADFVNECRFDGRHRVDRACARNHRVFRPGSRASQRDHPDGSRSSVKLAFCCKGSRLKGPGNRQNVVCVRSRPATESTESWNPGRDFASNSLRSYGLRSRTWIQSEIAA